MPRTSSLKDSQKLCLCTSLKIRGDTSCNIFPSWQSVKCKAITYYFSMRLTNDTRNRTEFVNIVLPALVKTAASILALRSTLTLSKRDYDTIFLSLFLPFEKLYLNTINTPLVSFFLVTLAK